MRPDYTLSDRDFINPDTLDLYCNTKGSLSSPIQKEPFRLPGFF